ncbi:MAG: hypothetical protein Kow0081_2610 [Candidatus Dojkabacteria bacterium]
MRGSVQHFEFGSIYHSNKTDYTWAVYGQINKRYIQSYNENGPWGFPRGPQFWVEEQKMSCQEFDGGRLCDYDWAVCGNSKVEERIGETCDDGNSVSGDGCSEVCRSECPVGYHYDKEWGGCVKDFLGGSVHPLAVDPECISASIVYSGSTGHDDFGYRCFIQNGEHYCDYHDGTDIRSTNPVVNVCEVNAVANGIISYVGVDRYGGQYTDIAHTDGFKTRYLHGKSQLFKKPDPLKELAARVVKGDYVFTLSTRALEVPTIYTSEFLRMG